MKTFSEFDQLYVYPVPVDFRKSIDGLAYLVEQTMTLDPFQSALFVFCNKLRLSVIANACFGLFRTPEPALFLFPYFYSKCKRIINPAF
ncbi:IS66 family insertion sequence element accessory protein TnpB [Vibrio mediterranei]